MSDLITPTGSAKGRWVRAGAWFLLLAAAFGLGWWAAAETLRPPPDPRQASSEELTYTVVEDTVGSSVTLTGLARNPRSGRLSGIRSGTITSIDVAPGDEVSAGSTLLTIDLQPVVVARGDVPAFRALGPGARGADVEQLQRLLAGLGYLLSEPDSVFGATTTQAVRRWQADLGVDVTGVVDAGILLFLPALPARIALVDEVSLGAAVAPGQVLFDVFADHVELTVTIAAEQRRLAPVGTTALVTGSGISEEAEVTGIRESQPGQLELVLTGPSGEPFCNEACAELASIEPVELDVELFTVPFVTGAVVPVAALLSEADGGTVVQRADGSRVPVDIVVSARGLAVVDGVSPGDVLRIPTGESR